MDIISPIDPQSDLYSNYSSRMYRYILSLVHDPHEADDLVQETFLRAYRRQDTLRDPRALTAWLYRIATHACLNRLRQRAPQALP